MLSTSVLLSMFFLSGCVSSDIQAIVANGTATSNDKLAPTNSAKVRLYFGNQGLPKYYKVIGRVSADNYSIIGTSHTQNFISAEMKKQAASIGGTGVINISSALDKTMGDVITIK